MCDDLGATLLAGRMHDSMCGSDTDRRLVGRRPRGTGAWRGEERFRLFLELHSTLISQSAKAGTQESTLIVLLALSGQEWARRNDECIHTPSVFEQVSALTKRHGAERRSGDFVEKLPQDWALPMYAAATGVEVQIFRCSASYFKGRLRGGHDVRTHRRRRGGAWPDKRALLLCACMCGRVKAIESEK
eukprot:6190647-Pleurochrysis_carterae.AAC.1